jgi:hypothetical protein
MSAQTDSLIAKYRKEKIRDAMSVTGAFPEYHFVAVEDIVLDAIADRLAAIEAERDGWRKTWEQEQAARSLADEEVERTRAERDAWKATATRAAEYCMAAGVVCDFCQHDSNNCIGIPCPVVDEQVILAHFGAPEEEK